MNSENASDKTEGTVEGTLKAVTGLVKEVPVYQDAIQPVAKEAGKTLQTVGKAVNAALMPIRGLVWGMGQIESFVSTKVASKLENVPPENIQTPDLAVAGPALESLRYVGHKESLAELYANLLASSMDSETAKMAHPGFVEIIRNLSSDEAKILAYMFHHKTAPMIDIRKKERKSISGYTVHELISTLGFDAGCENRELTPSYLVNLERLGLIAMDKGRFLTTSDVYDRIMNDSAIASMIKTLETDADFEPEITKYYAQITQLGRLFGTACIETKDA